MLPKIENWENEVLPKIEKWNNDMAMNIPAPSVITSDPLPPRSQLLSHHTVVWGGYLVLVHGQVTIIFVLSVCMFVCAEFFSAVFDPISIKLGHMLYVWV